MTASTPSADVSSLIERLGYHRELPVSGRLVLRNPDGPEAAIVLKRYREALEQIERLEPETFWGTRDRYTGERPEEKALVESEVKDIARAALKAGADPE